MKFSISPPLVNEGLTFPWDKRLPMSKHQEEVDAL